MKNLTGLECPERINTGEKPYVCKYLRNSLNHQITLKPHDIIHTEEMSFNEHKINEIKCNENYMS